MLQSEMGQGPGRDSSQMGAGGQEEGDKAALCQTGKEGEWGRGSWVPGEGARLAPFNPTIPRVGCKRSSTGVQEENVFCTINNFKNILNQCFFISPSSFFYLMF